jgi:hypothetical protein
MAHGETLFQTYNNLISQGQECAAQAAAAIAAEDGEGADLWAKASESHFAAAQKLMLANAARQRR